MVKKIDLGQEVVDKISRCQNVTTIKSPIESEEISTSQNVTSIKSPIESEQLAVSKNLTAQMWTLGNKGGRTTTLLSCRIFYL